jgi:Zn-dependent peptidase ImmA (M78 family)
MNPSNQVLMAISKALNIKPEYFLKKNQTELGEISFRKKTGLSKKNEDSIIEKARDYVERYLEIEDILQIKHAFINPVLGLVIFNNDDAENAANLLRQEWELGINPIVNIVEMLELKGIKVLLIDDNEDIDGFATFTSTGIPVVVVNTKDKPAERIRFTIIHELAHILLIFDKSVESVKNRVEILCHCFSSCFLIPSQMLKKMIGTGKRNYIDINELISIKEYYGISIRAIIHRLKELEVITPVYYTKWTIYLSKTYGAKNEPGKYIGEEKSEVFEQLVNRAMAEELISISKAAYLRNITVNELRKETISVIE